MISGNQILITKEDFIEFLQRKGLLELYLNEVRIFHLKEHNMKVNNLAEVIPLLEGQFHPRYFISRMIRLNAAKSDDKQTDIDWQLIYQTWKKIANYHQQYLKDSEKIAKILDQEITTKKLTRY